MKKIFGLTFKAALRDPYLLFWSILLPVGGCILLGVFIKVPEYPARILTGMMAVSVLFFALVTVAFYTLAQRRRGVYNLLRVTPSPLWQYISAVSGAWTVVSVLCSLLVLAIGGLVFGITISAASVLLLLPILLAATIGYVFLSFLVSSLSKNEGHVNIISNLIILPLMFCSDAFYSLEQAPNALKIISRFNPFQWFINGLRSALAADITGWLVDLGLLAVLLLVALGLAIRTFRFSDK